MNMQDTSFAGSETAEAYLVDEAQYLQFGGESAAVVTHGKFATDHFVDEDEIGDDFDSEEEIIEDLKEMDGEE